MHGTNSTESNDSWLKIEADDFFAKQGSSIKYPKGGLFVQSNTTTEGASKNGWMKIYCSSTTNWTWSSRTSDSDAHEVYATFKTAGAYKFLISGRSKHHAIDRFVLFKDSQYSVSQATSLTRDETVCIANHILEVDKKHSQPTIYPNPAKECVTIENSSSHLITNIELYSLAGQLLYHKYVCIQSLETFQLNVQKILPIKGVYLLNIIDTNQNSYQKRLIIK